jgi:nucleoid-associated protein YgaU
MAPETSPHKVFEYTVQSGDTWSGLAGRFLKSQARYPELLALNDLSPGTPLFVGQKLRIPLLESSDEPETPEKPIELGQGAVQQIDSHLVKDLKDKWVQEGRLNAGADDVAVLRAFVNDIEQWDAQEPIESEYIVQPGDSWTAIAGRFLGDQARFQEIMEFNQLPRGTPLRIGQKIRIPPQ